MNYRELNSLTKTYLQGFKKHFNIFLGSGILASLILIIVVLTIIANVSYDVLDFFIITAIIVSLLVGVVITWGSSRLAEGIVEEGRKIPYRELFKKNDKSTKIVKVFLINTFIAILIIGFLIYFLVPLINRNIPLVIVTVVIVCYLLIPLVLSPMIDEGNSTIDMAINLWIFVFKNIKIFCILALKLSIVLVVASFGTILSLGLGFMTLYALSGGSDILTVVFLIAIIVGIIALIAGVIFLIIPNFFMNCYILYIKESM
ncbi:MAG: hypothetical protein ACRCWG_11505 [Sarcina sp.]